MNVHEVKELAHQWVRDVGSQEEQYIGSFLAGSINRMDDDAPWRPLSDVDIFTLVDREITGWSEQRKFLYQGVIVESVVFPVNRFQPAEKLLGRVDAINLTPASIIADPRGYLSTLATIVAEEYRCKAWTWRRCLQTSNAISSTYLARLEETESLPRQVYNLLQAVMQMAQLPALAQNLNPTVRQCLVASQTYLTALGHQEQQEGLLTMLGSVNFTQERAFTHLQYCMRAFDYATTIHHTPFWGDFDVNQAMRPLADEGGRALIDDGYPREAIWWILFIHTLAQIAIQNGAPATEKAHYLTSYRQILNDLGLSSRRAFQQRAQYGQHLLDEFMQLLYPI